MDPYSSSLAILSAMITPVVLISACGTLIMSTSNRLTAIVASVREYSDRFEALKGEGADGGDQAALNEAKRLIIDQLERMTNRARLLQNSLTIVYLALGAFVATSVSIAAASMLEARLIGWLPAILAVLGVSLLLVGSILMIVELRLAILTTYGEMDFLWKSTGQPVTPTVLEQYKQRLRLVRDHLPSVRDEPR